MRAWSAGCKLVRVPAMSAPLPELSSSISSSGYTDGLGRRALAFDRVTGGMLEHLYLRPELAAFERGIRDRVANLASFDDDHFARVYRTERDVETGELKIVSAFVPGTRLSDLIDTAESAGFVPGVDVAIGFLLNGLPALTTLHNTVGFAHGLIDPARTVVAPNGHIVFLDPALGNVMERLALSRRRLWTSFGIAAAPSSQSPRFDAASDVAQVALTAVTLVLGRRLRESEYPDGIASLLTEVGDIAQIRASSAFASGFRRILQRSLPLSSNRPYAAADEMTSELRMLVRREIGVDACRAALIDFVERMDAAFALTPSRDEDDLVPSWRQEKTPRHITTPVIEVPFDHTFGFDPASIETVVEPEPVEATSSIADDDEDGDLEFEISLDEISIPRPKVIAAPVNTNPVYDLPSLDAIPEVETIAAVVPEPAVAVTPSEPQRLAEAQQPDPTPVGSTTDLVDAAPIDSISTEPPVETTAENAEEARTETPLGVHTEGSVQTPTADVAIDGGPRTEHPAGIKAETGPEPIAPPAASESAARSDAATDVAQTEPVAAAPKAASRRKRRQKSVRARKDKLRSTAAAPLLEKQNPTAPPSSKSGWLVPPDRARTLEEFIPAPHTHVPQPTAAAAAPTPVHMAGGMAPTPVSIRPEPAYQPAVAPNSFSPAPPQAVVPAPPPPMPRYGVPAAAATPASITTVAPIAGVVKPDAPALKIKSEPPAGYTPTRKRTSDGGPDSAAAGQHLYQRELFQTEQPKSFPWKLAAAALVIVAIGVVGGRAYLAGRNAQAALAAAPAEPAPEPEPEGPVGPPKGKGQIIVQTDPAGARVLLDGKPVGESPLTLDAIAPGRHTLTFVSSSGTIKKTVRVAADKIVTLNVPVFSGWLALFAPVVLDVSEDGKALGTTEDKRLMLTPGHHKLTLTNRELRYSAVQEVDVDAGQVTSLTIDPRGTANFNANPWAEVWMDGRKLGDTPLASLPVPLGVRDFIFKHPEHGERKVTMKVRADEPAAVSVDFTKPQ
jgi:PEGA domain